ncbi:MAG: DUF2141 domain-containing protein [Crocinitomicaceae bacterium]
MKTLLLTFTLLIASQVMSQSDLFNSKMQTALESYSKCKTSAEYISTAFQFQQIANVETQNWLPEYYYAMCYISLSYRGESPAKKDASLDEAEASISKLKILAPNESEIYALEGLFNTARLRVNPMERGQKYSILSRKSVGMALALDSNNVRAKQLSIANEFGTAQFFGSDTEPICKKAQALLAVWDDYIVKSSFHPIWGKNYLTTMAKSCEPKEVKDDQVKIESNNPKLTLKINDLASNNGIVLIQVKDENEKVILSTKGNIEDQKSTVVLDNLPTGKYSISYFHDSNANMKMDRDKYGRPLEGYGFSNNVKALMKAPEFEKTIFAFNSDLSLSLKTRN